MQDHTEQHLDKLAKKVMQSSTLESPSLGFTANIMAKVKASGISHVTVYKPLISKRTWLIIAVVILGGLSYAIFGNLEGFGLVDKVDLSVISNNRVTEAISGIAFSKTLMYAIGVCGLVFFIQIPMMKYYLNKNLEY